MNFDGGSIEIPGYAYAGTWYVFGVLMSYGNKIVFNFTDFKYPVLLSTLHMVVNSVLVYLFVKFTKIVPEEKKKLSAEEKKSIRYFVVIFCLNIAFGNISIRIVDLALSQMLRATMPVFSITLSYIVLGSTTSIYVVLSLVPIVAGVALMSITNVQFSFWNAAIIFIGVSLCAIKGVQTHVTLKKYKIHPFVLLMNLAPLSSVVMFGLAIVFLEVPNLVKNFGEVYNASNILKNTTLPLLTAVIAFILNILSFLANRGTSPLTMAVLGNLKQATVIFTSIYIFKSQVSWLGIIGVLVAICGMFLYTFARYHHGKKLAAASATNLTGDEEEKSMSSENNEGEDDDDGEKNEVVEEVELQELDLKEEEKGKQKVEEGGEEIGEQM